VNRAFFRSFAQGNRCLSAGFLAFGLGGLIPPGLLPAAPPGQPMPVPPLRAVAPQQTQAAPHPTPTPPLALISSSPVPPAPAEPAPQTVVAVPPEPRAPQAPPSPLHFLDTHKIPSGPFGDLIFEIAGRYSLNPHLVAAVVRVESSFNPRAMSRKGACGLMQLLPETARRFGLRRRDIFDPAKNLEAGVRYLKWLSDRFGHDPVRVLAAYNAGEGAVQRYGGVPPYKETRSYVRRIYSMLGLDAEPAPSPAKAPVKPVEAVLGR
jgi:soluble lytic murein transglycosylase-like protein